MHGKHIYLFAVSAQRFAGGSDITKIILLNIPSPRYCKQLHYNAGTFFFLTLYSARIDGIISNIHAQEINTKIMTRAMLISLVQEQKILIFSNILILLVNKQCV